MRFPARPSMSSSPATGAIYEIKSADLPLVAFQLKSGALDAVDAALAEQLRESPGFFEQEPVLIDLDGLPPEAQAPDLSALLGLLQKHGLRPLAIKSKHPDWCEAAMALGLVQADDARIRRQPPAAQTAAQIDAATETPSTTASAAPSPASVTAFADAMVLDKPLRSGQQCYAKGRDLIVLAMVNPGAEVLADGHIHVYAPLRGKAIAGARGNTGARIFAQSMDPELISIAGVYRTSEHPLPPEVRGQAAQVFLQTGTEGDKLVIRALKV